VSRAQHLAGSEHALPTDTTDQLRRLNPSAPLPPRMDLSGAQNYVVTNQDVITQLKKLASGAAPANSGWTFELLLVLAADELCINGMVSMVQQICDGDVPADVADRVCSSRLVAVAKAPRLGSASAATGVRPIAIPEPLVCVAQCLLLRAMEGAMGGLLPRIQLGVGQRGGSETAILAAQSALEADEQAVAILIDSENAFNACSRTALAGLLQADRRTATLWRLFDMLYCRSATPMVSYSSSGGVDCIIKSASGVRQGEPMSSFLFAFLIQGVYQRVSDSAGPGNSTVLAVLDDLTIVARPAVACRMMCMFQLEAARYGVFVRIDKCAVLWPRTDSRAPEFLREWCEHNGVALKHGLAECLGAVVGHDQLAMHDWAIDRLSSSAPFFARLTHDDMPKQVAWLLLRLSGVARLNYLCRTLPPAVLAGCAARFDFRVLQAAAAILGCDAAGIGALSRQQQVQLTLPLSRGGAGLRMQELASPAAFFGAILAAAPHLHQRQLEAKEVTPGTQLAHFLRAREKLSADCGPTPPIIIASVPDPLAFLRSRHPALNPHLQRGPVSDEAVAQAQRDCTQAMLSQQHDTLVAAADKESAAARRLSHVAKKGVSAWLLTQPVHPSLRLSSFSFLTAMRHLLGMQPHTGCARCHCGMVSGNDDVEHHQVCPKQKRAGNTMRHNTIKSALEAICREAGLKVESEPVLLPPPGLAPVWLQQARSRWSRTANVRTC
jgi:Reverse transcriptase (RNA-dependent DNA polymerase)